MRGLMLALVLSVGCKGTQESSAPEKKPEKTELASATPSAWEDKPTPHELAVTLKEVLDDYEGNALKADGKYKGKRLRVVGKVDSVKQGSGDKIDLLMNDDAASGQALCYLGPDQAKAAAKLSPGDSVIVDGTEDGKKPFVLLRTCVLATTAAMEVCRKLEKADVAIDCKTKGLYFAGFGAKGSHAAGIVEQFDDPKRFETFLAQAKAQKDLPHVTSAAKAGVIITWKSDSTEADATIEKVVGKL